VPNVIDPVVKLEPKVMAEVAEEALIVFTVATEAFKTDALIVLLSKTCIFAVEALIEVLSKAFIFAVEAFKTEPFKVETVITDEFRTETLVGPSVMDPPDKLAPIVITESSKSALTFNTFILDAFKLA